MREAHCHIAAYGESLGMPDLASCRSVAECLDRVREAARGAGGWVRLHGARIEGWTEARWPTLEELDAACPGAPCVIMSFDHHAAAANSRALAAAGVRGGEVIEPKGLVCADPHTGRATGVLLEHAAYRVWGCAPEATGTERRGHVRRALDRLWELGFREVHDLHSQDWLGPTLAEMERAGELRQSVWLYPPVAKVREAHAGAAGWTSALVRLAGGKLFADGTLNSRTALMLSPYREPLNAHGVRPCGRAMATERELDDALETVAQLGLHLAVHAIGDGAVRMVLDAWERRDRGIKGSRDQVSIRRSHDPSLPSLRIEHCEVIDERDVPRFAELGVTCSVQPCHLLTDIDVLERQLPHRLHRVLPLRELVQTGCTPGGSLWFGSDAPIVRADPEDSILAATYRRRAGEPESRAIGIEQRLSDEECRACFGGS